MFTHLGHVLWRTPLYPYSTLTVGEEHATINDLIEHISEDPIFLESIYWSSKSLYRSILKAKCDNNKVASYESLRKTIHKYLIRSASRCTPYGIHAGCSLSQVQEKGGVCTGEKEIQRKRRVQIDITFLQIIVGKLEQDAIISPHLHYYRNDSIYRFGEYYRFGENDGVLAELKRNHLLDKIYAYPINTVFTRRDLSEWIGDHIDLQEHDALITDLLGTGFIHLEASRSYSVGISFLSEILNALVVVAGEYCLRYLMILRKAESLISQLNGAPLGMLPLSDLDELDRMLGALDISVTGINIFHVDLLQTVPTVQKINENQIKQISDAIEALGRFSAAVSPSEVELTNFKRLFLERYELKEMPLCEVLDAAYGIGFPCEDSIGLNMYNELTQDLLPPKPAFKNFSKIPLSTAGNWLKQKLLELDFDSRLQEIKLQEATISPLKNNAENLSNQFCVLGSVLPSGEIFLNSIGGANGVGLISRFAYMSDAIKDFTHHISNQEQSNSQDVIFAEVVHTPGGRIANVARPSGIYPFEIPVFSSGLKSHDKQISVTDLMVSVTNNEIVLRSKKLKMRIIPRILNAYNHTLSNVGIYRFLAAIQHQGIIGLELNWSYLIQGRRIIPRISFNNVVLQRAAWQWTLIDMETIRNSKNPITMLRRFLTRWKVPQLIVLEQGDNELFIDTNQEAYLELLWQEMHKMKKGRLIEWLYGKPDSMSHINQFVLPLKKVVPSTINTSTRYEYKNQRQRVFIPASEWLYFKIYCNAYHSDRILQRITHVLRNFVADEQLSQFFFIRYSDPHYHIRLRLKLSRANLKSNLSHVMSLLKGEFDQLKTERYLWKIQIDSYERELERYDESTIENVEYIFFADSKLILKLLEQDSFAEDNRWRLFMAMKSLDKWLDLYEMDIHQRIDYCGVMSNAFGDEFGAVVSSNLDKKYREFNREVSKFMTDDRCESIFDTWSAELDQIPLQKNDLPSLLHMNFNRWFSNEQRLMEYMVYLFCWKYYRTQHKLAEQHGH